MYFLVSGEGSSDIGKTSVAKEIAEGDEFTQGPACIILEECIRQGFPGLPIEPVFGFVSESALVRRTKSIKLNKRSVHLPGKKSEQETGFFFQNARILAMIASELEERKKTTVIAVLFRDSDGTRSSPRSNWHDKWKSIRDGFLRDGFKRGVPMLARPKLEAWLICALRDSNIPNCNNLEKRSGNDGSPNSLKGELAKILGGQDVNSLLKENFDFKRVAMPSFETFIASLKAAIKGISE